MTVAVRGSSETREPAIDREAALHAAYAEHPSPELLDELVQVHRPYAQRLAARMYRGREPLEDLYQVALEALVVALRRFEPERGVPFRAYATPSIFGALKRHYRDHGWAVRVPRSAHETVLSARDGTERFVGEHGRSPTEDELRSLLDISAEALNNARQAVQIRETESLDAPADDGHPQGDRIGGPDLDLGSVTDHVALNDALGQLDSGELEVVLLYFFDGLSQERIAERCGISQMQVSRQLRRTLGRLRSLVT